MFFVTWLLHWTTAGLVIAILLTSLPIEALQSLPATGLSWIRTHIFLGVTVLAVTIARLPWKVIGPPRQRRSRGSFRMNWYFQWSLLILLLALSVTGLLAFQQPPLALPVRVFGVRIAPPIALDHSMHMTFVSLHRWIAFAFPILLVLHIAQAFRYEAFTNRALIWRMLLPWPRRR
jgi:cytochrome b561